MEGSRAGGWWMPDTGYWLVKWTTLQKRYPDVTGIPCERLRFRFLLRQHRLALCFHTLNAFAMLLPCVLCLLVHCILSFRVSILEIRIYAPMVHYTSDKTRSADRWACTSSPQASSRSSHSIASNDLLVLLVDDHRMLTNHLVVRWQWLFCSWEKIKDFGEESKKYHSNKYKLENIF